MKKILLCICFAFSLIILTQPAYVLGQTSGYKVIGRVKIGGEADWDYSSVFEKGHELFVSHDTEVDIVNLEKNKLVGRIRGLSDVHGTAFAPEFGRGFISDGRHNSVVIFNLKTLRVIKRVKTTGHDPDAILYDPFTERVFAFNGNSTNATAIDARTGRVVGSVQLTGSPEFGVSDFHGRLFVNIEKKNELNAIDPRTLRVVDVWPIPPCVKPSAMAIDRKRHRLFVGARNRTFAVVDAISGRVIASFPIGSGVDACRFDPSTHLIFCSTKDGYMSVFREDSPDKYSFLENIKTLPRAKTMALDEHTHLAYTSAMIDVHPSGRTFGILILGKR